MDKLNERLLDVASKVAREIGLHDKLELHIPLNEEGLGLSSLGKLILLSEVEKEFQIEFPEKYWGTQSFKNLLEICQYIDHFNSQ